MDIDLAGKQWPARRGCTSALRARCLRSTVFVDRIFSIVRVTAHTTSGAETGGCSLGEDV
jgi:hypothetical protein